MFLEMERQLLLFKILQEKNIPRDIYSQVYRFMYGSIEIRRKRYLRAIGFFINVATSRKNGFDKQEEDDTEDPHWIFYIPRFDEEIITNNFADRSEVCMQAVNCRKCGDYQNTYTQGCPICNCDN